LAVRPVRGHPGRSLSKQGYALSTRGWVASFAPGTTTLIGTVDYRFVYAVEPPHAPADWMRIVGQVSGYVEFNDWQTREGPFGPGTSPPSRPRPAPGAA
jgi:hypothetical protein